MMKDVIAVGTLLLCLCAIGVVLSGCERGPTEENMRGCATHRTPTWGDVIDCKAARREETVK